jgi:hypothetical protein
MAKTGVDTEKKTVSIEVQIIVDAMIGQTGYDKIELNYSEAYKVIAEWWEGMRRDGVNVAAEVQRERSKIR